MNPSTPHRSSFIVHRSRHSDRSLNADVGVDVVELSETPKESKAGPLDRLAKRCHVFLVIEVVYRIAVRKADHPTIDDLVALHEADPLQLVDRARQHRL